MDININRTKSFSISLITEGIDISKLSFWFSIEVNEMVYSFPANMQGDQLKVILPPLAEKINGLKTGKFKAYLESYSLNEDNKGFYLRPWSEEIELKIEPKLTVKLSEEKEISKIKAVIVEDKKDDIFKPISEVIEKKKSKFISALEKENK